jgi:branched-chain amino acid transport system permease protein
MSATSDNATVVELLRASARSRVHQLGGLLLVLLAVLPLFASDILLLKLTGAMFFAVFTISWDFVSGYTGYISFGHAVFFGASGYGSAILNAQYGMDPLVTIPIGILAAVVVGILIGVPALRLEGPYLSLLTLIAPLILLRIFVYFGEITGGQRGLIGVEKLSYDPLFNYYLGFAVLLIALVIALGFTRSNLGTIMKAISGDEEIVSASGLNPAKYKIVAFVISGGLGGIAGAVYVHTAAGSATPSLLLSLLVSANVIIAAVIGGMGTITGAAIGGFAFYMVRDFLRNLDFVIPVIELAFSDIYLLLLYFLTMAVLIFLPEGFVPWIIAKIRNGEARLRGKQGTEAAPDSDQTPRERTLGKFRRQLRAMGPGEDDDER